jgi:membrane protein DedA with SNARE-associated domain
MISMTTLLHLLIRYGYFAVLFIVALESMGVPAPGETILLAASVIAGTTRELSLPLVIAAAAGGAILGDNLGYWMGYIGGARLLSRYGHLIRFTERKRKLGLYLFRKHGGKVVFLGRFVTVLRMWAALLAGTHHMSWTRFLCYNALGGIIWATCYGTGGYLLGTQVYRLTGPLGLVTILLAIVGLIIATLFLRRYEHQWEEEAERAFPGAIDQYSNHREAKEPVDDSEQHMRSRLSAQDTIVNLPAQNIRQEQASAAVSRTAYATVTSSMRRVASSLSRATSESQPTTPQNKARLHHITLERFSPAHEQQERNE